MFWTPAFAGVTGREKVIIFGNSYENPPEFWLPGLGHVFRGGTGFGFGRQVFECHG